MIPTNKKLAILHPYLNKKWWAANMMIYLSNFLSNKNNVIFYAFSYDEKLFPVTENSFSVKCFNNSKLVSFFKIAYEIRNSDYIFIWNSPMHFVWVISKLLFRSKAKIIWWHHHYPWYYGQKTNLHIMLKKILEKCIIKNIDSVIANSKYLQDSIKDIYKIDSKILYPVLDNKFLNHTPPPNPLPSRRGDNLRIIFSYWRWEKGKNLEMIFRTYEDLKDRVPNLVLKIWWEWKEIKKYKNKFRGDKNVYFLWQVDKQQIIENLDQSSLVLFPSRVDSFWLVILESMSIWNPVISYNLSWAKEIIKNWTNWYLVDSDSEFIERSYEILVNSLLRNTLSIEAINTSMAFTENTFNKQLSETIYYIYSIFTFIYKNYIYEFIQKDYCYFGVSYSIVRGFLYWSICIK